MNSYKLGFVVLILLVSLGSGRSSSDVSIRTFNEISGTGKDSENDVLWSVNTGSLYEPGHYEAKGLVDNFPYLDILTVSYTFFPDNGTMISTIQLADTPQLEKTYFSFQFKTQYQNGTSSFAIEINFQSDQSRASFHYSYSKVNSGRSGGYSLADNTFNKIVEGTSVHFYVIIPNDLLEEHPIQDLYNETNFFFFRAYTSEHIENIDSLIDQYTEEKEDIHFTVEYEKVRRFEYWLPFISISILIALIIILIRFVKGKK